MTKLYDKLYMNMGIVLDLDFFENTGLVVHDNSKDHVNVDFVGAGPTWIKLPSGPGALRYSGAQYIRKAINDFRISDFQGSVEIVFRAHPFATNSYLLGSCAEADTVHFLGFVLNGGNPGGGTWPEIISQNGGGDAVDAVIGDTDVQDFIWRCVTFSSDGGIWQILVNGRPQTLSIVGGNNGDWFGDITGRVNITSGAKRHTAVVSYLDGDIGLIRVYSTPVTIPMAERRWRQIKSRYGL